MRLRPSLLTSFLRIHLLGAIFLTLGLGAGLAAAPVPHARLVGEWEDKSEPIQQLRLSLRPDGTYRLTVQDLGGPKSDQGQWRLDGDTLVLLMTQTERRDDSARTESRFQVDSLSEKTLSVRAPGSRSERQFTRARH